MEAKQYLSQIDRLNKIIQNKLVEIYQLKTMAQSITISNESERVQTSGCSDIVGNTVAKIVDKEREIEELTNYLINKKSLIISQIEGMEDTNMYHVLFNRYVKGSTFESIAEEMHYSTKQINRIHGEALLEFDRLYNEEYKDFSIWSLNKT